MKRLTPLGENIRMKFEKLKGIYRKLLCDVLIKLNSMSILACIRNLATILNKTDKKNYRMRMRKEFLMLLKYIIWHLKGYYWILMKRSGNFLNLFTEIIQITGYKYYDYKTQLRKYNYLLALCLLCFYKFGFRWSNFRY